MPCNLLVGASLSEPHTSVTSLHCACVCVLVGSCKYRQFEISEFHLHVHNNIQILATHLLDARNREPSSYLFNGRWRQQRRRDHSWTLATAPRTFCLLGGDTRTKTVPDCYGGPTAMPGDVAARLLQL